MLSSRENKHSCPLVHICRAWSRYENAETTGNPQQNYQAKETHSHVAVLLASHTQQSARVELCGLCLERFPFWTGCGKAVSWTWLCRPAIPAPSRRHPGSWHSEVVLGYTKRSCLKNRNKILLFFMFSAHFHIR